MTTKTLSDIASDMRGIDIAMLATKAENGHVTSRPMSNNGDVEYDGDSYYFTHGDGRLVAEIERDPRVALTFTVKPGLLSGGGTYIAVEGQAELIRDKGAFKQHWISDLDNWFEQGVDTPGLTMVKVHADHIRYWSGKEEGEIEV